MSTRLRPNFGYFYCILLLSMNYSFLVAACMLVSFSALGGEGDTLYYNNKWLPCEQNDAAFLRSFTKDSKGYNVTALTVSGKVLMTGHVSTIKWTSRKVYENQRNGKFVYYSADGQKIKEGVYENGVSTGKWLMYLPGDTKKVEENYYNDGALDSSKSIEIETGRVIYATYKGRLDGEKKNINFEYYPGGSVKKMYLSDGKKTTTQCMDEKGTVIPCDTLLNPSGDSIVEELPVPPSSIMRFLSQNVIYPESARSTNKHGRSLISFVVMEDGSLAGIKPVNTVCPEIDEEAMRVIALLPKFKPGMQNGKVVKVLYTQPLMFKLQ